MRTNKNELKLADVLAYPPRAMRLDRAAAYLSMSTSSFLRLVEEEVMPKPVRIKGLVTWDRLELDAAFDNLKGQEENSGNTMHRLLGISHDEELPLSKARSKTARRRSRIFSASKDSEADAAS